MRPDASTKLAAAAPQKGPNKGVLALVVVLVVALIAVGAYLFTNKNSGSSSSSSSSSVPKGALAGGKGLVVNQDKAKAGVKTVDIYEDFQCPICKDMETTNGSAFEKMSADGKIKLNYHVVSFLDNNFNNTSSAEAANAAFCAADENKFLQYHNTVFAHQPKQEGTGYTKDQLKSFGKSAGLSGAAYQKFTSCVDAQTYKGYVSDTENRMGPDNVTGTPTVKVNGKAISQDDTSALIAGQSTPEQIVSKY